MTAPAVLGRYTLLRRLASGGMGEVYLGQAQGAANFTRKVAIKRILPHLAGDESFVRKFIDEAHLMVQLHHGNIVPVQELVEHEGELYLVMEYLPGRDLKTVIRRLRVNGERMPADMALWLIAEVLGGLDYAHRKVGPDGQPLHIVHRDVSPANVVLGAGGEVKLIDFGIARARGGLHHSISGTLQGKFVYMSPEQADGRPVDPRSDVFSAGLLLYELLTGVRPFEADTETAVLRKVRDAQIPPPSEVADLDLDLDALVMPALAREVDDRYDSAASMRRALLHNLADRRSEADAAHFGRFLAGLFPEGVVPDGAPAGPLSIDDALQMQLGALTPSARFDERTRTRTGDPLTPRRRATDTPSQVALAATATASPHDSLPGLSVPPGDPRLAAPMAAPPRRRLIFLGLALGIALSAAALALRPQPGLATIAATVTPADAREVRLSLGRDETVLTAGTQLEAGRTERVCASATGFAAQCQLITLSEGVNRLRFELVAVPQLDLTVEPPEAQWTATVNDLPVDAWPYDGVIEGRLATIRLHPADGWSVDGDDRQIIRVQPGLNALQFRLLPQHRADARPAADAGPDAGRPALDRGPKPPRAAPPQRARVELTSTPTASVTCAGQLLGPTPQIVQAEGRDVVCTLTADDHAPSRVTIRPRDGRGPRHVTLKAMARLTARAIPPAAVIYLDGEPLGPNLIRQHRVTPGRHVLDARLVRGTKTLRSPPLTVHLEPGQTVHDAYLLQVAVPSEESP